MHLIARILPVLRNTYLLGNIIIKDCALHFIECEICASMGVLS